ncbi:MAG: hypothetical protein MI741_12690 [Rhodospirillales bacterium]|nr:hypothetical protein [Rhodospirillales bacterium]
MKKIDRVRAALRGDALDRPPYGFWTHMPGIDLDPDRLAEETANFCRRFDMDFIKSMPNGLYCVEDWGCECDYGEIAVGGVARVTRFAANQPADWAGLRDLDVTEGAFGRELRHLGSLVSAVGQDTPVLATVFSPVTIAQKMSGGRLLDHLSEDPDSVGSGLETITRVTEKFAREAVTLGCAGIFFAVQDAVAPVMDAARYEAVAAVFDRRVLAAADQAWFNVLHMHGENVLFNLLKDYPVHALNWHIGETPPSIAEYRAGGGTKPLVGGLVRTHITNGDVPATLADLERSLTESQGHSILISPACVIRHPVNEPVLSALVTKLKSF